MDAQDIPNLSILAERLGWSVRVSGGLHVVDLLVGRTVTDLISALAESRDG